MEEAASVMAAECALIADRQSGWNTMPEDGGGPTAGR